MGRPRETSYLPEEEGAVEAGWWTPDPRELQFGEGEKEYLIDLLMGSSTAGEGRVGPPQMPAAMGAAGSLGRRGVSSRAEGPASGGGSGEQANHGRREKKGSRRESGGKR